MIKLLGEIPREVTVACSGGVDSMVAVNWLQRNHRVSVAFFHHGTEEDDQAFEFVQKIDCEKFIYSKIKNPVCPKGKSIEEYWRDERYKFLHSISGPVITCHHLDDVVETWIWSSLHGEGKLIPYSNKNVFRPFLLTQKSQFIDLAKRRNLTWYEDETNQNRDRMRNLIRHDIVPHALIVNPGLKTVIVKKIQKAFQ